jgi:hypothetical protein
MNAVTSPIQKGAAGGAEGREVTAGVGGGKVVRLRRAGPHVHPEGRSAEARKLGAAILEVLAGARTPTDAAKTIGVSLPRYYALEIRALDGLLQACEPRTKGRKRTPEREADRVKREMEKLERECARTQALLRVAQRSVGLSPPPKPQAKPEPGMKRRKRRGTARALKAAVMLKVEGSGKPLEKGGGAGHDAASEKS